MAGWQPRQGTQRSSSLFGICTEVLTDLHGRYWLRSLAMKMTIGVFPRGRLARFTGFLSAIGLSSAMRAIDIWGTGLSVPSISQHQGRNPVNPRPLTTYCAYTFRHFGALEVRMIACRPICIKTSLQGSQSLLILLAQEEVDSVAVILEFAHALSSSEIASRNIKGPQLLAPSGLRMPWPSQRACKPCCRTRSVHADYLGPCRHDDEHLKRLLR